MFDMLIQPRDPLLVRDGRPFGVEPGAAARTLPWPFPQTVAGAVRTWIGNSLEWGWSQADRGRALRLAVHGPLLAVRRGQEWQAMFPRPLDALTLKTAPECAPAYVRLRPHTMAAGGCLWPDDLELLPVLPPEGLEIDAKATRDAWWPLDRVVQWLAGQNVEPEQEATDASLKRQGRVHVAVDPETGTGVEGALYSTENLVFSDNQAILCRLLPDGIDLGELPTRGVITLGGERRISLLRREGNQWPACPEPLLEALEGSEFLSLTLATPAVFSGGWKPGWVNGELCGTPPCHAGLRLRLVGAAVSRHLSVSGWRHGRCRDGGGPKPVRRVAPAGSVYYFRVIKGELTPDIIGRLWLSPLSDSDAARNDGYGLALPGVWADSEGGKTQ